MLSFQQESGPWEVEAPWTDACREMKLFQCREDKETMSVYPMKIYQLWNY